jgi:hypothetical protein
MSLMFLESWKISIRAELYNGLGLISGALLLLTIALAVHNVTKQKLFTVIIHVQGNTSTIEVIFLHSGCGRVV